MRAAVHPRPRPGELLLVIAIIAGGTWLRWVHLEAPSLWWDELVHVRIADQPTVSAVWRAARDGAAPGTGNAGAVPLDYLALHAWLRLTPAPAPEAVERHYRAPAFAFAVAALPLAWALGRTLGGPAGGTVALTLLATSMPHVLYAAEARFYSLYVLATLANLAAFAALVRAPSRGRLVLFTIVTIAYVLSGLYGVFPVAAEYLVLGVLAWRSGRDPRRLGIMVLSGLAVAGALAAWIVPTSVTASYGRGTSPPLPVASAIASTLLFFAAYARPLAVAFGVALVLAPVVARRDRVGGALGAVFVLSVCAIPVIVSIAHGKQYYYHPRHALFLLPMVLLASALVVGRGIARLIRAPSGAAFAGAILGLMATAATVHAYVTEPLRYFAGTKTLRDYRGLARTIATRLAGTPTRARYLLVLEKRRPGHLANPTAAYYLRIYGLADRVTLIGVDDPLAVVRKLPTLCTQGCRGPAPPDLPTAIGARDPYDQPYLMRLLMELRPSPPPSRILAGLGVIAWSPNLPPPMPGATDTRLDGLVLFEPAS
jgi:uncharacterized membrane protein